MNDWPWDRKKVYGLWGWRRRHRLNLTEHLFEAPSGNRAVVLYHIGDIGLDCQVGHLLVLKDKAQGRVVWRDGRTTYWYAGDRSVEWVEPQPWALLYQCSILRGEHPDLRRRLDFRLMVVDLEQERMARWEQPLDRCARMRIDDRRVVLEPASPVDHALECKLDALSWRPFGHWQR